MLSINCIAFTYKATIARMEKGVPTKLTQGKGQRYGESEPFALPRVLIRRVKIGILLIFSSSKISQ